jgi:predicted amidophosphoribosyltransferase
MTHDTQACQSCSMPIESGTYCSYCLTPAGELQPFEERFEKMVSWQMRNKPGVTRQQAEQDTLAFMRKMPAWQNHPRVAAR